ncbi:MAG: hypothetical protein AAGC55_26280 [Myxococcota bacterium]
MSSSDTCNTLSRPARATARPTAVHILPASLVLGDGRARSASADKAVHRAAVADCGVAIRVDWAGDGGLGRFEVEVAPDCWRPCRNLAVHDRSDVIYPDRPVAGTRFVAHLQRGPLHPHRAFAVKALPITWRVEPPTAPLATVLRDRDYVYADSVVPERVDWHTSRPIAGVQRVTVPLQLGCAYELWVRLQHPTLSERWQLQDPILDTDTRGGGQEGLAGAGPVQTAQAAAE